MRVTVLGTSGAVPTAQRNPSAVFVNREGDQLLFDCGEGTQRQMMRFGTGFAVDHVFLTHCHGDHVLGLPGLVQTMDFNERTAPLAIHAPAGTRSTIEDLVGLLDADIAYPIRIDQCSAGDVVLDADDYVVRAVGTDHRCPAVGYVIEEDERKGRFDREKAEEELGIPPGPAYSTLHAGEPVELDDGRTIQPEQVVGPSRPGRTVVYTGDTVPTDAVERASEDADLLIHDATFASDAAERAERTAHATARQAGELAARAGVRRLALVHVSSRYAGDPSPLLAEAREVFDGQVWIPDDGWEVDVPFPDEA